VAMVLQLGDNRSTQCLPRWHTLRPGSVLSTAHKLRPVRSRSLPWRAASFVWAGARSQQSTLSIAHGIEAGVAGDSAATIKGFVRWCFR
jgi:hypothetical protein